MSGEHTSAREAQSQDEHIFRVHAVCRYLRGRPDKPCELCPLTFTDPTHGECVRGCVALAEEVINIAVHGNPWGEKAQESGIKRFREAFNAE